MPSDPTHASAATLVSGERGGPSPNVSLLRGRGVSLPGYSEAGLVERSLERYEIVRPLGSGGMGEVALVQDHDIDRAVAVKYLHHDLAAPALIARFVEEIRTVGRLEHPNIVPIHDAGRDEAGRYFFVMKHIEGETLESIIDKLRAGDPAAAARYTYLQRVEIFIAILNALQFAHENGYVHRDVKPANVMVGRAGEVVLMDWGLTKSMNRPQPLPEAGPLPEGSGSRPVQTRAGTVMGTPEYMSPEQAAGRNDQVDARSDLYSAAALFHELMFLEHYLDGCETAEATLAGARTRSPRAAWTSYARYPRAPPAYLHICVKGLQKEPAKRFQSAEEFIARLRRVQDGTAPIQCAATFLRRTTTELSRLVDRNPGAAMLLVGGTGALFLTSAVLATLWLAHALS